MIGRDWTINVYAHARKTAFELIKIYAERLECGNLAPQAYAWGYRYFGPSGL